MKKIISLVLTAFMLLSVLPINTALAADTSEVSDPSSSGNKIYFDANGWNNYAQIYCHIWQQGGDSFFAWQSTKEKCTKESGTKYSYNLDTLNDSSNISGGFKSGVDYCVIFSANTGRQTYDCTIGKACIGDTARITGNHTENPVDSEKYADEIVWDKNSNKYGPHLSLTSVGNVVGKYLCPNEKATDVIGDWIAVYYNSSYVDPVNALAYAFPKFKIKNIDDIEAIYKHIRTKVTTSEANKITSILEKAFYKAYPSKTNSKKIDENKAKAESGTSSKPFLSTKKKTMVVGQTFKLKVKKASGKVKYSSTKKKVASVNKKGKITARKNGKTTIRVKVKGKMLKCKITVKKPSLNTKSATLYKNKYKKLTVKNCKLKVKWSSSDKKVATINSNGFIKAVGTGKAVITAKFKGYKLKCKITVKDLNAPPMPEPYTEPYTEPALDPTPVIPPTDKTIPAGLAKVKAWVETYGENNGVNIYDEIKAYGFNVTLVESVDGTSFGFQMQNKTTGVSGSFYLKPAALTSQLDMFLMNKKASYICNHVYIDKSTGVITDYEVTNTTPGYTLTTAKLSYDAGECLTALNGALATIGSSVNELGIYNY